MFVKQIPKTREGFPIYGRIEYVLELTSRQAAADCLMPLSAAVKPICPAAQLYTRGTCLVLDMPEGYENSGVVERAEDVIRYLTRSSG